MWILTDTIQNVVAMLLLEQECSLKLGSRCFDTYRHNSKASSNALYEQECSLRLGSRYFDTYRHNSKCCSNVIA